MVAAGSTMVASYGIPIDGSDAALEASFLPSSLMKAIAGGRMV
jgi:hypothetical protein